MRIILITLTSMVLISMLSCNGSKKANVAADVNQSATNIEIIAQLKGKVKPSKVVAAYQKYKLELIEIWGSEQNTWLFSYDTTLIDSQEMLMIMQNSQFVANAKFRRNE